MPASAEKRARMPPDFFRDQPIVGECDGRLRKCQVSPPSKHRFDGLLPGGQLQAAGQARMIDRAFVLVPLQSLASKFLMSMKEFPPSQTPGDWSLETLERQVKGMTMGVE